MSSGIGDPAITAMIRHHHERLDGRGYPDGLAGEEIPLGARIIAVADTFDAITSNRTYRRAARHKRALDVLAAEAGKQLDAAAVAAFSGYYRGRRTIAWSALAIGAPQRLLSWLGSASPAIGASAAGATALAIGMGHRRRRRSTPPSPSRRCRRVAPDTRRAKGGAASWFTAATAAPRQSASRRSLGTTKRRVRTRAGTPRASRPAATTPSRRVPAASAPAPGMAGTGPSTATSRSRSR